MNQPSSLPTSVTGKLQANGIGSRVGTIARDAAPTLGAYLNIIRARKWLVIFLTLLITAIAFAVVNLMTPIYRASVTLLIENNKSKIVSVEELYGVPAGSREFFQTQAEFMKSREVGMRVVNELNLTTHEDFDPRQQKPGRIQEWLSQFEPLRKFLKPSEPRLYTDEEATELALSRYKTNIEVVPVRLSQLVEIRFENPDPVPRGQDREPNRAVVRHGRPRCPLQHAADREQVAERSATPASRQPRAIRTRAAVLSREDRPRRHPEFLDGGQREAARLRRREADPGPHRTGSNRAGLQAGRKQVLESIRSPCCLQ